MHYFSNKLTHQSHGPCQAECAAPVAAELSRHTESCAVIFACRYKHTLHRLAVDEPLQELTRAARRGGLLGNNGRQQGAPR